MHYQFQYSCLHLYLTIMDSILLGQVSNTLRSNLRTLHRILLLAHYYHHKCQTSHQGQYCLKNLINYFLLYFVRLNQQYIQQVQSRRMQVLNCFLKWYIEHCLYLNSLLKCNQMLRRRQIHLSCYHLKARLRMWSEHRCFD